MQPLIAGNWKMRGTAPQLGEIAGVAAVVRKTRPAADIFLSAEPHRQARCAFSTEAP